MSKRKYKIFIDIVLVFLCLFPLISLLITVGTSSTLLTGEQMSAHVLNYIISPFFADSIFNTFLSMGVVNADVGAPFGMQMVIVLMSNTILIYLSYLLVSVLVFIPKFAIKLLNFDIGGKH